MHLLKRKFFVHWHMYWILSIHPLFLVLVPGRLPFLEWIYWAPLPFPCIVEAQGNYQQELVPWLSLPWSPGCQWQCSFPRNHSSYWVGFWQHCPRPTRSSCRGSFSLSPAFCTVSCWCVVMIYWSWDSSTTHSHWEWYVVTSVEYCTESPEAYGERNASTDCLCATHKATCWWCVCPQLLHLGTIACQGVQSLGFSRNTGVGCPALLRGIFPTQGLNQRLLHYRWILYWWANGESPC